LLHFFLPWITTPRLYKVLDAERVSKRGMKELMGEEGLEENALKYAVYKIALE
jgi:hypothetical protein